MENSKPKVMILGTMHLRSTPDLHRIEFNDISKRHVEIKSVVESIKRFKPTKLAFEIVKEKGENLNKEFQHYLDGKFELSTNEVHQFGFVAAAQLGHKEIFAVDWMGNIGQPGYGEVMEWAEREQPELFQYINDTYFSSEIYKLDNDSIFETIKRMNEDKSIKILHESNMHIARIRKEFDYVGIDWLRWWYQRNLIIYSNLTKIMTSPTDRILLLIGASHVYLVKQFLEESGLVEIEPAINYLI